MLWLIRHTAGQVEKKASCSCVALTRRSVCACSCAHAFVYLYSPVQALSRASPARPCEHQCVFGWWAHLPLSVCVHMHVSPVVRLRVSMCMPMFIYTCMNMWNMCFCCSVNKLCWIYIDFYFDAHTYMCAGMRFYTRSEGVNTRVNVHMHTLAWLADTWGEWLNLHTPAWQCARMIWMRLMKDESNTNFFHKSASPLRASALQGYFSF